MKVWPLKFRELQGGSFVFADDAGGFFKAPQAFLDRYAIGTLNEDDDAFLLEGVHAYIREMDLPYTGDPPSVLWTPMLAFASFTGVFDRPTASGFSRGVQAGGS